ncbi:MAG TPA: DNA polymerase III subunit beta [Chloroflexi bacterium]|jgi:DNA polymerase-3 subunit beta|nr:DNA polymerase III subunit beta [Chloroflexota bacterium]
MKVSCLQENLARGLSVVGRAVATRSTLPVLSNILLSTDESRLKLSATNLEIGINCWIGAKVQQEGSVTVPARLLTDFVNSLPSERLDMELITRTQTLNLKSGRFEANIKGIDAQEFPLILVPEKNNRISLNPDVLREMIDQVVFAAASEESRPVLTGVLADISADRIAFAAADGYRLSVTSAPLDNGPAEPVSVIIPARALQELRRITGEEEKAIEMLVAPNRSQVFFHLSDVDLVSQLIEGTFPDYRQIIPQSYNTRTVVNTVDLLKAVRMAFIFARDAANIVRLQVIPDGEQGIGRLVISASSSEHGDNVSELDAAIEGAPIEIAFNARYLIDVLSIIDSAQVALETRDPTSSGVIRMVGGGEFVHVIMPVHIAR